MVRLPVQVAFRWWPLGEPATGCEPTGPANRLGSRRQVRWPRRPRCRATDKQSCCGLCKPTDFPACDAPRSHAR